MTLTRSTLIAACATASLFVIVTPAIAEVNVGVTLGYPGGYGIAQPVQPLYGPAPVYVAPGYFTPAPRPYYYQRDEGRAWHEREERAAEWRYRHEYRHHENDWRHDRDDEWRQERHEEHRGSGRR